MTGLARLFAWRGPGSPPSPAARRTARPLLLDSSAPLPSAANDADHTAPRRALAERRGEALRAMFPMLYSLYARRPDLWHAIAIERYLSQASNLTELEQRIHEVERRKQFLWAD